MRLPTNISRIDLSCGKLRSGLFETQKGFPKLGVPFWGIPILTVLYIVFEDLHRGLPIFGNCHKQVLGSCHRAREMKLRVGARIRMPEILPVPTVNPPASYATLSFAVLACFLQARKEGSAKMLGSVEGLSPVPLGIIC